MNKALIHSIFLSTEGEGIHIGTPQVFVRFQGCHIRCKNCDTKDSWDFNLKTEKTLEEIIQEVEKYQIPRVSITGGDPLDPFHKASVVSLIKLLKRKNYFINIETTGLEVDDDIFSLVDFISMDFKTPSTGISSNSDLILTMIGSYLGKFQIKSVIENREDFNYVFQIRKHLGDIPWVLTPAYKPKEKFPMKRFQEILSYNEESGGMFKVIGQQHKWIWGNKNNILK